MTGKDVKRQQQALIGELLSEAGALEYTTEDELRELDAALADCVVLTREEAWKVALAVNLPDWKQMNNPPAMLVQREALALLSPDEADDE